jgi:transposase
LAKYKKKGASQKQESRPSKGKNSKLSPKQNQNIPYSCKSQEN